MIYLIFNTSTKTVEVFKDFDSAYPWQVYTSVSTVRVIVGSHYEVILNEQNIAKPVFRSPINQTIMELKH